MVIDKDIYRSAQLLVTKYKAGAENYAIDMVHEFRATNNQEAVSVWIAIADAVRVLRQEYAQGGEIH